jgi:hypothetical protein
MKRMLMSWNYKLVVAWVRALDVGHVVHARVGAKVSEGCAVVEGFLSQLRVAVRFATVQGTVLVEADGVGHCVVVDEVRNYLKLSSEWALALPKTLMDGKRERERAVVHRRFLRWSYVLVVPNASPLVQSLPPIPNVRIAQPMLRWLT